MDVKDVSLCTTRNMEVRDKHISSMDAKDVSLCTPRSIGFQVISLCTTSSMDVRVYPFHYQQECCGFGMICFGSDSGYGSDF